VNKVFSQDYRVVV